MEQLNHALNDAFTRTMLLSVAAFILAMFLNQIELI
jgi:hypothetical protein